MISVVADSFQAIGTGLYSTKRNHPKKFNYTDPQRDIIWINKDEECATMRSMGYGAANIE